MRKFCEENERIKRQYLRFLREAKGQSEQSVDKVAASLVQFEESTNFKPFKSFHIDQASAFKTALNKSKTRHGKPLSKATISATVRTVKTFFQWLAWQPGFKKRIRPTDCEYFNLSRKDEAVAHAHREKPFPSIAQALHAFRQMPNETDIEKRNKAIFAFLILTAIRDGAAASLKLKHVDLVEGEIFQDAREVKTKAAKTAYTTFYPVAPDVTECFSNWVTHLRETLLFGPDDPLFPQTAIGHQAGTGLVLIGLKRAHWSTAASIRKIVGDAFEAAGLPRFGPHSFRKTLEQWGAQRYKTPEAFKAFSQNLGHESVLTTFMSYGTVSRQRQAEIIKAAEVD